MIVFYIFLYYIDLYRLNNFLELYLTSAGINDNVKLLIKIVEQSR
jgi:hypothetical protein